MPLGSWARIESRPRVDGPVAAADDLHDLFAGLTLPPQVAAISYPRGCRIRRVRVRSAERPRATRGDRRTVIVSRRALEENRPDR
jgi:hypothetical protein